MVVTGCAAPDDPFPAGASDLVLRVVDTGGLLPRGAEFELPALSLYGDGLLILGGDRVSRRVTHRRLSVEGVRRVVRAAVNAGLTKEQDYGAPQIVDGPVSIFTVVTSRRFETTIVAPSELSGDTAAQSEARRRVHAFRKALNDLDSWLGDEIGAATEPGPGQYVVFSYRTERQASAVQWLYGDLPDGGCRLLPAAQMRALPAVRPGQLWQQGDNFFVLMLRPLLPDEKGCADIK